MVITFVLNNLLTVIFSAAYIPQIKRLAPELLVPALLVLALQMILSVVLSITSAGHTKRKIALQQEEEGYAFEVLKGMQKIQNRGVHRIVFAKIADKFGRSLSAEMTPPLFILLHEQIITIVSAGGTALLLILAAASGMPQADYIAFTVSFGLISESVGALVSMCGNAVMMRPLIQQLSELFSDGVKESGVEYVRSLKGEIEISDLCFSYEAGRRGCVNHINLHISPGEKLAIVGESGCGKSTLLKLLLGMIDPDSGTILYDGKPLATLNKRSLRRQIASVFQFTRVFPGTIYDNICLNAPGLSEEEAMKAAEQAAIADNIRSLKLGLETEVTEGNGGGFSGGQKQRLNLARAFAQKPSVLILDEATSALDNVSQHKVLETVYGMKGTVIMVAHRLSTVIDCDRIIVLKDGCIVGEGNYEELIHSNDYFAELVRKQTPAAGSQAG